MAPPAFSRAVAHGVYRTHLRAMIHLLKYDGMRRLAEPLGRLLAAQVAAMEGLPAEMTVIPVPLFARKYRQRGFNQAEVLARAVIRSLRESRPECSLRLAVNALERRRETESHAGLNPSQRRRNVRGAFFVPKPDGIRDGHILLVDDIYTTGATARACSQVLRKAGAKSVTVATVARAQLQLDALAPHGEESRMEEDVARWDSPATGENGFAAMEAISERESEGRQLDGRGLVGRGLDGT